MANGKGCVVAWVTYVAYSDQVRTHPHCATLTFTPTTKAANESLEKAGLLKVNGGNPGLDGLNISSEGHPSSQSLE